MFQLSALLQPGEHRTAQLCANHDANLHCTSAYLYSPIPCMLMCLSQCLLNIANISAITIYPGSIFQAPSTLCVKTCLVNL